MRKRLVNRTLETIRSRSEGWLDVERAATVEITSEEKDFPVESAFASGEARGWRAAEAGPQTIRLVFDRPHSPPETTREVEEYQIELSGIGVLELTIVPNISGGTARASLKSLRLS